MKSFNSVHISPDLFASIQAAKSNFLQNPDNSLLQFKPPKSNMGLAEEKDLFETFHLYESESTRFKHKNISPVCGYEVWIDPNTIDFSFYTSSEEVDNHYRKQLITHYNGCQLNPRDEKFIKTEEGQYLSAVQFNLNHHYFEPIRTKESSSGFINNPYKSIFGELTLKEGMNAMIQFLYKPAEEDWTALNNTDVNSYAEKVAESNKKDTKLFGLKTVEKDSVSSDIQSEISKIKRQNGKKGFYMDVRIIITGPDKDDVEEQIKHLINLYDKYFTSPTGQSLHPYGYNDPETQKEIVLDMVQRNPKNMRQPKHPKTYVRENYINNNFETLIMSVDELVTLAPIPFESGFRAIDKIDWADTPLDGTVTGLSEEWEPLSEEEKEEQLKRLQGSENTVDNDPRVKIPEQDPSDTVDNPDFESTSEPFEEPDETDNNTEEHTSPDVMEELDKLDVAEEDTTPEQEDTEEDSDDIDQQSIDDDDNSTGSDDTGHNDSDGNSSDETFEDIEDILDG